MGGTGDRGLFDDRTIRVYLVTSDGICVSDEIDLSVTTSRGATVSAVRRMRAAGVGTAAVPDGVKAGTGCHKMPCAWLRK